MIEKSLPEFQQYWEELEFQLPSAIQKTTYTPLKEGKDVVGISPTGTGKTIAYTLPSLEKVEPNGGVQLVILAPSQELAVQVSAVAQEWGAKIGLNVQPLIGGASRKRQIEKLREKPEVIVGTPGRILEIAETKKLKLHQVKTVILDEADHLLQQEQLKTVREVIKKMPADRQMGFFSATSNEVMTELPKWFNVNPVWIDASSDDQSKGEVLHAYLETPVRKRAETLKRLANIKDFQALVFVNDVASLTLVYEKMVFEGVSAAVLHSDKNKTERQQALQKFRDGKIQLLLTTDLASRGLDIPRLPYVVQYDWPQTKESYIHRSGRTARMGQKGTVLTLVNERELREFKKLIHPLTTVELKQLYLYGGQLVEERPENGPEEKTASNKKPRTKNVSNEKTAKPFEKPRKKNRKKDTKNKGARKKKS